MPPARRAPGQSTLVGRADALIEDVVVAALREQSGAEPAATVAPGPRTGRRAQQRSLAMIVSVWGE